MYDCEAKDIKSPRSDRSVMLNTGEIQGSPVLRYKQAGGVIVTCWLVEPRNGTSSMIFS